MVSVLECTHPLEAKHIIYNPQEGLHSAADAKSRKREVPWGASQVEEIGVHQAVGWPGLSHRDVLPTVRTPSHEIHGIHWPTEM